MKAQACQPCAKRKVRCDREEPCSNCKRRKQDTCSYSGPSPADRIKKLETLVKSLGGNPERVEHAEAGRSEEARSVSRPSRIELQATPSVDFQTGDEEEEVSPVDSIIIEEDGESVYLESYAIHSGGMDNNNIRHPSYRQPRHMNGFFRNPLVSKSGTNALQSILYSDPSINLIEAHPKHDESVYLWDSFRKSVQPLLKMSFERELDELHRKTVKEPKLRETLTASEHAFMFALYLFSINSLSDTDCMRKLNESRSALFSRYQFLCEQALMASNFFWSSEIIVLQAMAMYIVAGLERLNIKSLWAMMGLILRNAERIGVHREGSLLGLSPYETERRRRLWWQLQHTDVALALRSGSTPMTFLADWDVKLPLNIEDSDINPEMTNFPPERKGLTTMSYVLWCFWIIQEQRTLRKKNGNRIGISWASARYLSQQSKEAFRKRLEEGLNKRFLQYCDIINPLHNLIQLTSRSFITAMRRVCLQRLTTSGESEKSDEYRRELVQVCVQGIEYSIAAYSTRALDRFKWRTKGFLQWRALLCIVVDIFHQPDPTEVKEHWDQLARLYTADPEMYNLEEDLRKLYTAELMLAAWNCKGDGSGQVQPGSNTANASSSPRPEFLDSLEERVLIAKAATPTARPRPGAGTDGVMGIRGMMTPLTAPHAASPGAHSLAPIINLGDNLNENSTAAFFEHIDLASIHFEGIDWSTFNDSTWAE